MIRGICACLLVISLTFFVNEGFCQKAATEQFLKISKSYLDCVVNNKDVLHNIDTSTVVFMAGADTLFKRYIQFYISFDYIEALFDLKYKSVYKLENYKLIIFEESGLTNTLVQAFEKATYEDLNKGKRNGARREDFQSWSVIMNKNYEVVFLPFSAFCPKKLVLEVLKKNKVKFSKDFNIDREPTLRKD